MTWHLDRVVRATTACLLAAVAIVLSLAFTIDAVSDVGNVLGAMLVASILLGIGGLLGSIAVAGVAMLMFGGIAAISTPGAGWLLLTGCGLFIALYLVDLSVTLRRSPNVERKVWIDFAATMVLCCATGVALFGLAWFVATRATWQAIVVPFGVIAVGFAMRLAADALTSRTGS